MYITYNDIASVHIEHTSKCNLLCPQCARVYNGVVKPELDQAELTLKDYHRIFTPDITPQIKQVWWCGSYGDSIASGTWVECAYWLRYSGIQSMQLYTNGSARPPDWWRGLANIFNRADDYVYFSIDGLADTNHLYRVNSNWKIIMKNVKAFINAGGNARWDYLIFDHNKHQIKEVTELAKELGFKSIVFKNTSRFIGNKEFVNSVARAEEAVYDKKTKQERHKITDDGNKNISKFEYILEKYGTWDAYVNATPIECIFQKQKSIYVDFNAKIWPCCWTGTASYLTGKDNIQYNQMLQLLSRYEKDFNSSRLHSIKDILEHKWFNNDLADSWKNTMQDSNAKLHTCGRSCGTDYEFSSALGTSNAREVILNG